MSFKLFIYYCAVLGGWAALLAWAVIYFSGIAAMESPLIQAAVIAAVLGMGVAGVVGLLDAMLNHVGSQRFVRVLICLGVGAIAGLVSGLLGQFLHSLLSKVLPIKFYSWVMVGAAIGMSIGLFDLLRSGKTGGGAMARRKMINGLIGGIVGGLLGGLFYDGVDLLDLQSSWKRTSLAVSLVFVGSSIAFLIGLTQVILKEASIKVEAGFRAGRQMMLSKPETVIGRAEGSDIGLFGDTGVERTHAKILLQNNRYVLEDASTPNGTYLNEQRISGPTPLRSGDAIKVGNSILRFEERHKRPAAT